ncbi:CPBP family glutamic-type intramembrane protease [Dactylosporangium sp. CA-233914]|uniref:CPBP family glutamic-type intramembrane protease n=1 Tax=Dactylosporangium sp. CA-233914 TaxID=3239934 RepID=UPI003D8CB8B0
MTRPALRWSAHPVSIRTKGVLVYLAIAFGVTWPYLFVARLVLGLSLVNPLVQLPVATTPAIAAIVVRRWVTREGFADAGLTLRLRAAWNWWLLAWLGPFAIIGATMGVAAVWGWWQPDPAPIGGWAGIVLLLVVPVVLTPLYWGEEFGWTGYLRTRMVPGRPGWSVAATGLIWAIWHYPLAYLGYVELTDHSLSMLLWTVSFMLQQAILSWLCARSGSVWVASLAHAGNNMIIGLLSEQVLTDAGGMSQLQILWCSVVVLAAACLAVPAWQRVRNPRGRAISPSPGSS